MALPFIAGLVVGSAVAVAFSKREKIKDVLNSKEVKCVINKGREISKNAYEKINSEVADIKDSLANITKTTKTDETTTKKTTKRTKK